MFLNGWVFETKNFCKRNRHFSYMNLFNKSHEAEFENFGKISSENKNCSEKRTYIPMHFRSMIDLVKVSRFCIEIKIN